MSYLDLLSARDVQASAADALQRQTSERLAVMPKASLADASRDAMQRNQAGQQLALGERRLQLAEQQQDFEEDQQPWAIAGGVASLATSLYGGYRALEQQKQSAAVAQQQTALTQQIATANTASMQRTLSLVDAVRASIRAQAR